MILPEGATSSVAAQIQEQKESNSSAIPHFDAFAGHRARLTEVALAGSTAEAKHRLCVLGAGNCYDLDLARLAAVYREIHLVDIDPGALLRAQGRVALPLRDRIFRHAPVDLSGLFDKLEDWKSFRVKPEDLLEHPDRASKQLAERLPGPFDFVLSACVLSQMQLAILNVLSSEHRLFEAVRQLLNLTHLRTLARLVSGEGRAVLATDVVSDETYPLEQLDPEADMRALLAQLVRAGNAVYAVAPELLAWTAREDPMLRRTITMSAPTDAWLWQNGPERAFLVYAIELRRVSSGPNSQV
jgi:hypothetical protein